jgi:NADPH-dependent 2,4-dienoyl-CoA reductase/sulfur reductase-like enzyme
MEKRDLVIIGGGSAGLSAAVAAFDLGLESILIIERGSHLGGILNQCIHTGFGLSTFNEQLTGPEYASRYMKMIEDRNIEYRLETNVLEISPDKIVTVTSTAGLSQIEAGAIILATGCYERNAGAILLPGDRPRGILTAGQAQEYINIRGYSVGNAFLF